MTAAIAAAPETPRFTQLSVDDGLSQSSVQRILQDRRGFFWFGTQEGLNRYDGYRFTIHRARDRDGFLADHDITALIADTRGDLWVGTSRGLYRHDLDTGRFDACAAPADRLGILELVEAGDGRIFFISSDHQLWTLEPGDTSRRARPLNDGSFAALDGITGVARAAGTAIWAAAKGRLYQVDPAQTDPAARVRQTLQDLGTVSLLASDPRGAEVWIARSDGDLLRYRTAAGALDRFPQAPRNILTVLPGKHGETWIGARGGGLSRLDAATGALVAYRHDPEDPSSLSSDDVASIYEDEVGTLWVGSWNGGVNRFDPHAQGFRTFRHRSRVPESLPADDVTAMTETADGRLWIASRSGRVGVGDPRNGVFRTAGTIHNGGKANGLGSLYDRVLIGTSRGLIALDAASGDEVPLDAALQAQRLDSAPITTIRGDSGAVWMAGGKNLFRIRQRTPHDATTVERMALPIAGSVSALSTIGTGRLWIGSDLGEVVRAGWTADGAVTVARVDVDSPADGESLAAHGNVSALHEDAQGRLWVGTRRGLGRWELKSGRVTWLGQNEGLPSTNIAGIAADADGRLWLGHNRGLTRIDPANGAMTHFGGREGAQGAGYAEGAWATGSSGSIYFAGEGVTAFDPRQVSVSPYRPQIVFTALEILHRVVVPKWLAPASPLDRAIDAQQEVTLGPDAVVLSAEMAPLHYVDPSSNRLRYRLEGFDPDWIETDAHNRVATYTNLAPGRYVLRARAGTKNGVWSEHDAVLAIRILPPWWKTRSAVALWAALSLAGVGLLGAGAQRRARVKLALLERETLRRESVTDPLTGLHNRRFLIAHLQHEVPKLLRQYRIEGPAALDSGADLLMFLVDVDHFKAINDRHSHTVGDRVLSQIAAVLRAHLRESDLAVRWGGDEFLLVIRSSQRTHAADVAERLRAAVADLGAERAAEGGPPFTLSIGFAAFPFLPREADALSWEQTLELADYALRLTKSRRRDSFTGLRAGGDLRASAMVAFLNASGDRPLPPGVEIVNPEEGVESES